MALSNYGELKTSVANWLVRADLTTPIADFVAQTHAAMMRDLRGHLRLQKRATLAIDGEYVAAPADFLELVIMTLDTNPKRVIQLASNDQQTIAYGTGSGIPQFVSLSGSTANVENFRFAPVPGGDYTATIEYYAKLPFFANDSSTNWILTDHPNAYLWGACYHGFVYLQNPQGASQMKGLFDEEVAFIKRAGNRTRWGGSGMQVRPA